MPPRTRGIKTTKTLKENIEVNQKVKCKPISKSAKPRKALSDKTNSASDDNGSLEIPKVTKNASKRKEKENVQTKERPRRDRRAPSRFVERENPNTQSKTPNNNKNESPVKNVATILSPIKTPQKDADNSLLANRPRRVCRLPSRFDDHLVSPNRFIPVGTLASTPIIQNKVKKALDQNLSIGKGDKLNEIPALQRETKQAVLNHKKSPVKKPVLRVIDKASSDTNNNAGQRSCRARKIINKPISPPKSATDISQLSPLKSTKTPNKYSPFKNFKQTSKISPNKNIQKPIKKVTEQSFSFRVLEDKKRPSKRDSSHLDVYEFTYDPNEEPPPQKKKRKRAVTKKPTKPRTIVLKNNYDRNVSKALAALKNAVSKKPTQPPLLENVVESNHQDYETAKSVSNVIQKETIPQIIMPSPHHASVQIEDIAADFEPLPDHHDIDYSPVTSPNRGTSPKPTNTPRRTSTAQSIHDHDPLNLRDDLSFFDDIPVASSSMNVSVRNPGASPWRVEFGQLPIKWHSNTYVKSNMTPAVESSFINFDDSKNKKKHVYTNLVPECNDALPDVDDNQPYLKQTSIISFMREVAEKSASKKKRAKSVTPTKANSMFEDLSNISVRTHRDEFRTPKKTPRGEVPHENATPHSNDVGNTVNTENKENCSEGVTSNQNEKTPFKSANKDKDGTFFGFDDSEDQENVSPIKIDNHRVRALRPRAKAVLQEINAQTGPLRANMPLTAKTKVAAMSEDVNKVFGEMKSATVAPVFPDKDAVENVATTNVEAQACNQDEISDDDSQSVHLFEDIELIHHLKPTRKSYGKAKKVTFRQASTSDSETRVNDGAPDGSISSGEDDLADLTFTMPNIEQKSKTKKKVKNKKKVLSKKEKAEVEAWAAGFNSMCEDIEEFPLLVE